MPRLLKSAAPLAILAAGSLAISAVPAAATPAFDTVHAHDGMVSAVEHSRGDDWRDSGRDSYRDSYRDRARYRDNYGRHGYYNQSAYADARVWRGRDGRYYCSRDDGTTGLLVGGVIGGVIGHEIAGGGDRTLGAILGVAGGALLGRAIDRGDDYRCR